MLAFIFIEFSIIGQNLNMLKKREFAYMCKNVELTCLTNKSGETINICFICFNLKDIILMLFVMPLIIFIHIFKVWSFTVSTDCQKLFQVLALLYLTDII